MHRSYSHVLMGHSCVGVIHMWRDIDMRGLLMCGGDINMWELLMCGGTFMCGKYSNVEGTFTCGGDIHIQLPYMVINIQGRVYLHVEGTLMYSYHTQ